ncbi:hypothetical protein ACIBCT_38845 [Streptosporangium sp. NPDC050855]|uniref:hypothetical protein n=1 Tax=Streptosporangium sp. NPDC050855 TaxID=3366194 RepID=UPI0037B2E644
MTPAERALRGRMGAHLSWANTADPQARTKPGRDAFLARFEREVDPEGVLPIEERKRRAESLRKAYMQKLALASAQKRRENRTQKKCGRTA